MEEPNMTTNERDTAPSQESEPLDSSTTHDCQMNADDDTAKSTAIPSPLKAARSHCLWCCNGSTLDVRLCASEACPLWLYRFGRNPTPAMLAEAGDRKMYPLEDVLTVAKFYEDGTALKAIRRRCLDCSGGCKSEVRDCRDVTCELHPFRLGTNPNRKMSEEQRALAAARLKASIAKGKRNCG
jgi:hypothetical protein